MEDLCNSGSDVVRIQAKYFHIVLTFFLSSWMISDIAAVKFISIGGITLTGGFLSFPFTSALGILIVDVYGYKFARQAIWCGCAINLSYLIFINIVNILPAAPEWTLEKEFQTILVPQTRIFIASILAFCISGFCRSYLMAKFKRNGMTLLLRIIFSLIVSITLDLLIFFSIAFWGDISMGLLKKAFAYAYIKKIICEILLLPLIWMFIDFFKKKEGFEIIDANTNFNPFSMENVYDLDAYRKVRNQLVTNKNLAV